MIVECNRLWQYQQTESGLILPYYTLSALEWLLKQDVSKWNVFEYGAGYSTIWFRANCENVRSIDHSPKWASAMGARFEEREEVFIEACQWMRPNPSLQWNCIIVDSEYWREKCATFAIPYLKQGGFMIIDNWESENYDPKSNEELFKDWPIQIFKQPNHSTWKTAVLTKP